MNLRFARIGLVIGTTGALLLAVVLSAQQVRPAAPMQIEKVKDGLYLVRGPVQPLRAQRLWRGLW